MKKTKERVDEILAFLMIVLIIYVIIGMWFGSKIAFTIVGGLVALNGIRNLIKENRICQRLVILLLQYQKVK